MNLKELQEKRGAKFGELSAIIDKAKAEKRNLSDEERVKYEQMEKELRDIDANISIAQRHLELMGSNATQTFSQTEERDLSSFSFVRAIGMTLSGRSLDGVEAEMHQEGVKQYRDAGLPVQGNLVIPQMILSRSERRDLTATGGSNGSEGGATVQTSVGSVIERLRAKLLIAQMGATMLDGLTGNIDFPAWIANDAAVEKGETSTAAESSPTFGKVSLSPNRLPVFLEYSRQLLLQSSASVEGMVRDDLAFQIAKVMDARAINGTGDSNQPLGILNTDGIGSVVGGTDGAAPDWDDIVDLESAIATEDADIGRLGYLTNPKVRGKLKKSKIDSGSGQFVWPVNDDELNGYKVGVTTQVPSTLTKGSSSGICSAIIFGNFADLLVGQWGGIEFLVNPYSGDKEGLIRINAWTFFDSVVRRAKSFAAMKDALT